MPSCNRAGVTRRDFVVGVIGIGTLFMCGFSANAFSDDVHILRPPGIGNEKRFESLCLKCDRCRSVCPQNCIIESHVEDGFKIARSPKLTFKRGYCDFCGQCADVCPTGAITHDIAARPHEIGAAEIDENECLAYNGGGCRKCVDVCPEQAVYLEGSLPHVNSDACTGCGMCFKECPSESLRAFSGSRDHRGINVYPSKDR